MRRSADKDERDVGVEHAPQQQPRMPTVTVGAAYDPAERDADKLAELALSASRDWRQPGPAPTGEAHRAATGGAADSFEIPAQALKNGSPGQALAPDVRARMEDGFGADFSGVRVHDGAESDQLSRGMQARAFTHGADIHFAKGEYKPGTPSGDRVLAHELAHVVQDSGGARRQIRRFPRAALSGPVEWAKLTGSVFRPGEGVSGGVYILTSKDSNDDIQKVVVKPVMGANGIGTKETGEQMVFGDRALAQLFGIKTPASRVVLKGSPEYADLLKLCKPYSPAPPPPKSEEEMGLEVNTWKPLSEAQSFIVMSEVPQGKSLGSLAEKAGEGGKSTNDLFRTVFDDGFLTRLGQLCIADLLVGNNDRLVGGAMNVGNVMVSMAGDKPTLYAIDTNAVLDKFNPASILDSGTASSSLDGGWSATSAHFKNGPGEYLDAFFNTVIKRVRSGTKAPPDPQSGRLSPGDLIESTYQANRQNYLSSFEFGWQDALITINALVNSKQGRKQLKGMAKEHEGTEGAPQLNAKALQANAMYLGAMAEGKSHEEAARDPAAQAAFSILKSFNPRSVVIPTDEYFWNVARVPGSALSADLDELAHLPVPDKIGDAVNTKKKFRDYDAAGFAKTGQAVAAAKNEAASMGTKSRGLFKKGEQPRNRTLAATFVAETYQLGMGAIRAVGLTGSMYDTLETAVVAVGGKPSKKNALESTPAIDFIKNYLPMAEDNLQSYRASLQKAASGVEGLSKYKQKKPLAATLRKVIKHVDDAKENFTRNSKTMNPNLLLNVLRSAAK